jgi:GNAT superfamily N-acetyltransferase
MAFRARPATPADVAQMHAMIVELAVFEREPDAVTAHENDLHEALFVGQSLFATVVDAPDGNGLAAMAIWFLNYSTWDGKHGIYLEDLYVRPDFRGQGIGKMLLKELAQTCTKRGYTRFQWWVLNWNQSAIDVYEAIGAKAMDEWTVYRVSGQELIDLANS